MNDRSQSHLGIVLALSLLAVALAVPTSGQSTSKPEQIAQQSAESWLTLIDSGKSEASWEQASSTFKAHVTKEQWQNTLQATLAPLGKVISRKLRSATYAKTLPGAPDGDYVVIEYETTFERKRAAVETITPTLDKDGQWRVSGYFIR